MHSLSRYSRAALFIVLVIALSILPACSTPPPSKPPVSQPEKIKTRAESIPADAVKIAPETDGFPPILHSDEYEQPVPMCSAINTAGAEDSPFITPDGNTFYIFFTHHYFKDAKMLEADVYVAYKR